MSGSSSWSLATTGGSIGNSTRAVFVRAPTRFLSEFESKRRLASYGIQSVSERLVFSASEAEEAGRELGFPVVAKLCGEGIAHKTERGLVRLGLATPEMVRVAAEELLAKARPEDGETGVLLGEMVFGTRELIAGVVDDPQFGKCVMIGFGGIFAEVLADVSFRLLPLTRQDAIEMIDDLETQAVLEDFRGEPPVNREKLVDILLGLSSFAEADESIVSVDVNPLIVSQGIPIAVDALLEVRA